MLSNSVCNHARDKQIGLPRGFVITCMITDRIGLHSVLLPLLAIAAVVVSVILLLLLQSGFQLSVESSQVIMLFLILLRLRFEIG